MRRDTTTNPEAAAALARLRAELGGKTPRQRLQAGMPATLTPQERAAAAVRAELEPSLRQDRRSDLERLRDRLLSGGYDVLDRLSQPFAGLGGAAHEDNPPPKNVPDFLLNAAGSVVELLNPTAPIRMVAGAAKGLVDTQQDIDTARRRYAVADQADRAGAVWDAARARRAADVAHKRATRGLADTGSTIAGAALGGVPGAVAGAIGGPELGTLLTDGAGRAWDELKNRFLTDPASVVLQGAGLAHVPGVRRGAAAVGRGVVRVGRAAAERPALGSGLGGIGEGPADRGAAPAAESAALSTPHGPKPSTPPADHLFVDDPAVVGAVDMSPADIAELRGLAQAEDPKNPRGDWIPLAHSLMSPLSVTGANGKTMRPGSYERIGGEAGKAISDTLREVQRTVGNDPDPKVLQGVLAAHKPVLEAQIDALRAGRGTPDNLPRPGLAEAVEAHIRDLERVPKPYEKAFGRTLDALTGGRIEDADGALRRSVDRILQVGNLMRLRWNVKSSIANLSQPLETLAPYISTPEYTSIVADYMKPETRQRLADLGVLTGEDKVEGSHAPIVAPKGKLKAAVDRIPATIKDPFGAASSVNRGIGYLYGEREARRQGVTDPEQIKRHGMAWAERVEFDSSPFQSAPLLRDTAARFFLQYKGFTLKQLENLVGPESITRGDMALAERVARLGKWGLSKLAPGGVKALGGPVGAGLAAWAYVQARDYAKTLGATDEDAEQVARVVALGLPTLGGADISSSVGTLEPPFGDTLAEQMVNLAAGPTIGTALQVGKIRTDVQRAKAAGKPTNDFDFIAHEARRITPYARSIEGAKALYETATGEGPPVMSYPDGEGHMAEEPASLAEQISVLLGAPVARRQMGYLLQEATPAEEREANREADRPMPRKMPTVGQMRGRMKARMRRRGR